MPPQQQPKGDEGSLDFLWMIVLVVAVILVVWYFGKSYIAGAIYEVKLGEILSIQFLVHMWDRIAIMFHLPIPDITRLNNWAVLIRLKDLPPDINTLTKINTDVGEYIRYPVIVVLLLMAVRVYTKNVTLKFKQIFTMGKLQNLEKENWPKIIPVVNKSLEKTPLQEGPWAMALTPMEFCKKNKLIKEAHKNNVVVAELLPGKTHQALTLQLGPLWRGKVNKLPIHMQVLCAIFAGRAGGDAKKVDTLLDQIATSAASGRLDFSGYKPLLNSHMKDKGVIKVMQGHAYVLTMMASMLVLARSAGVLATAEFLWLKAADRRLWYVLNSVGRQTAVAEIAGIFSHWLAEQRLGGAIKTPMLDEAVRGFKEALEDVIYQPDEEDK